MAVALALAKRMLSRVRVAEQAARAVVTVAVLVVLAGGLRPGVR